MNAELHLGQAEADASVIARHAVAAREPELEAATQRETIDGCHGGAGECRYVIHDLLTLADQRVGLLWILEAGELLDVRAGHEAARLAGADHDCPGLVVAELDAQAVELTHHIG